MSLASRRTALVSAALAVLIAAVYWPLLRCDFINCDDPDYVTDNGIVQRGITADGLKWAFTDWHGRPYWHPLTWASHMLDCQLFGLNPRWHHATNVLFHIANSILLLLFLNSLTGAFWPSVVVAAMFAVHPLQIETVAWVAERKSVLSTLFWLLASMAYLKFARTKKIGAYLACIALFECGLMSKPAVVTLPFVFLLLDLWPLKRLSPATAWPLIAEKIPFLVLSAASAVITMSSSEQLGIKVGAKDLPFLYRFENAAVSYALYLRKLLFPFDLAILYPHPRVWRADMVVISTLVVIAITIGVVVYVKRRPYLPVGWFWFIGVLVPVIGIVQAGPQAMADRFVYVPIIGFLIMIVWSTVDLLPTRRVVNGVLFTAALVYCIGGTSLQLSYWEDSETVFRRALAVTKNNYVAHLNLGEALFKKGQFDEAEFHARRGIELHNKIPPAYILLGAIANQRKDFSAAVSNYSRALELGPNMETVRLSLARAHASLGEKFMAQTNTAAGIQHYYEALRLQPDSPMVANNLAWVLATSPDAQLRNGAEAVQLGERACELSRNEEPLFIGTLAAAYAEAGHFADAIATAKRAQALALQKGLPDLAQRNAELLKLYEAGKAFHEAHEFSRPQ